MLDWLGSKSTEATLLSTLKLTLSTPGTFFRASVRAGKTSAVKFSMDRMAVRVLVTRSLLTNGRPLCNKSRLEVFGIRRQERPARIIRIKRFL